MFGVSICVTAYKAKNFIKETLDSIYQQTWFKDHDNWEVIIGVDGCQDTLDYLKYIQRYYDNHLRIFMMDSNRGTYITTNTIMKLAKYDYMIRFDSDDIFKRDGVEILMTKYLNYEFVLFGMKNFGMKDSLSHSFGVHMIKKSVFEKFGGYQPWPCSADSEMIKRIKNFVYSIVTSEVIFFRRVHKESLTRKVGPLQLVNGKGKERQKYIDYVKKMKVENEKDAIIECITNTYQEILLDKNYKLKLKIVKSNDTSKKIVIYTCILEGTPVEIEKEPGYDYVCFTNQKIKSNTWRICKIPVELNQYPVNKQKSILKICPHLYLKDYEISIYVDSSFENITGVLNTDKLYDSFDKSVFVSRIPRKCHYKLAAKEIEKRTDESHTIRYQMFRYSRDGYPSSSGVSQTNYMIRRHNDPECIRLMEVWKQEILTGSYLDQLSFDYCVWKTKTKTVEYIDLQ